MFESLRAELIDIRKSETAPCQALTKSERDAALNRTIHLCEIIRKLQELAAKNYR